MYREPPFSIGIEEEYLLVDPETRDLASDPPDAILRDCEKRLGSLTGKPYRAVSPALKSNR